MPEVLEESKPPAAAGAKQPPSRMTDARAAQEMIQRIERQHFEPMRQVYEEVSKKFDRFPPDDEASLRADGFGAATNINWGSMAARGTDILEPLYNLVTGGDHYLNFRSDFPSPAVTPMLDTLASEHKRLIDGWADFGPVIEQMLFNRVMHGLGILYFSQPQGWHFNSLHPANFIYVPGKSVNLNKHSWLAIRTQFEVADLLKVAENAEASTKLGWNTGKLRKAIEKYGQNEALTSSLMRPDFYAEHYKPLDLYYNHALNVEITGYVFLVQEFDGKITEHILIPHEEVGYIYSKPGKYDQFSDCLWISTHSLGDGQLNKVRGYGTQTLPFHDALDRLQNHETDMAFLASSLLMQAADASSLDRVEEIQFGSITVLPPGLVVQQQSFSDPSQALRILKADMRGDLANSNASFGGRVDFGNTEKTARETVLRFQDAAQQNTFTVSRFRRELNLFARTLWKKTLQSRRQRGSGSEEAKEFFRRAEEKGVIPELYETIWDVRFNPAAGDGNRTNTLLANDRIRQYFALFSDDGKREFVRRDITAATDDRGLADAYLGVPGEGPYEREQRGKAQLENAAIEASSAKVDVGPTDNHIIHLEEHAGFVEAKGQQFSGDPKPLLRLIERMLEHVSPHIQLAAQGVAVVQDPELRGAIAPRLAQVNERWSQIENLRRQLTQQSQAIDEKAARDEQATVQQALQLAQQPSPKDQQEIAGKQLDLRMREQEHEQKLRHAEEKHSIELRDLVGRV